jgi:FkbM family methyltransferase
MVELTTEFSFCDLFPDLPLINIVDVGALPLDVAVGGDEVYSHLMQNGDAQLIGFEPDQIGCRALKEKYGEPHRFFPFFIGDGKPAVYHKTYHPMTGSLYEPNVKFLSRFSNLMDVMKPIATERVQTQRLDDVVDLDDLDFLKMDVQGAELSVLKGAPRLAKSTLLIQSEVSFVPLYLSQPLFADVDTYLRNLGFQFHTFLGFGMRPFNPIKTRIIKSGFKQMLWSDAVYLPTIENLQRFSDVRLIKLSALLHDCYRSFDLALEILSILKERGQPEPLHLYLHKLGSA